ncbi:Abi family protein [Xanthomonas prunicola]|uniref:Abi family protein n=1 Tax=Xanthomonas prunicola TaxID=2053930 RepID=UPI0021B3CF0F|nr:Abi family protein [Xanthomonas prunicola]UXA47919.1 Abi family protein [Xanthomonas prunicola]
MRKKMREAELVDAAKDLSIPRLSSYRRFFGVRSDAEAIGLYQWNEAVAMNLFRAVCVTEVSIRNRFHDVLTREFGGASGDWYNQLSMGFKSTEAIRKITHQRRGANFVPKRPLPSHDDVVSKLTFGFWPYLLDVTRTDTHKVVDWADLLPRILVGHRQRNDIDFWSNSARKDQIFARLDLCNALRNRIAHHEPLWKAGRLFEERRERSNSPPRRVIAPAPGTALEAVERLRLIYDRLLELLGWMSPALMELHLSTEAHHRLTKLLSLDAIVHYSRGGGSKVLQLNRFGSARKFRRRLNLLAKTEFSVFVVRGDAELGQLIF